MRWFNGCPVDARRLVLAATLLSCAASTLPAQPGPQAAALAAADCSVLERSGTDYGFFRTDAGESYVLVSFERDDARRAFFIDYDHRWRGRLSPTESGRLTLSVDGAPRLAPQCEGEEIVAIEVVYADGARRTAARVPIVARPVQFANGDVRLSGTFFAPPGEHRNLPAAVFVHGSGPALSVDFSEFGLQLAMHGIASLAYDKRGAGASTGDWEGSNFTDLATDASSAMEALRAQPEVDASSVGMIGTSQGAWVGPIAASRSNPAFLVVSGGGPVTPAQQEFYRRMLLVEQEDASAAEFEDARTVLETWFEYLRDPEANAARISALWADLDVANRSWRPTIGVPSADPTAGEWPEVRRRFASELHFDPIPHYRDVEAPMLGIVGLEDQAFPVAETILAFNELAAHRDVTVVGIPAADHGWFVEDGPGRRIQAPEAYRAMIDWIRSVTGR